MTAEVRISDEYKKPEILQPSGLIIEFPTPIITELEIKTEEAYIKELEIEIFPGIRNIINEKRKTNPGITVFNALRMYSPPSSPEDY